MTGAGKRASHGIGFVKELFMSDGSPREDENRLEKLGYTVSLDKRDAA